MNRNSAAFLYAERLEKRVTALEDEVKRLNRTIIAMVAGRPIFFIDGKATDEPGAKQ